MPVPAPSQTEGVKFQKFATIVLARSDLRAGDIAAFVCPLGTNIEEMREVVKIDGPRMLMRCMCLMLENAVSGQPGRALIQGYTHEALFNFKHRVNRDDPLVVNSQGALTPDAERGDRIVAFSRCDITEPSKSGRTTGAVLFDGIGGFGPYQ